MNLPLISILIPFKNTEHFLSECLSSILDQLYTNWEVLAVNDSSNDASKSLVKRFSRNDSRIKVCDNEGYGIIEALRTAYGKSKGQLVTRMDSDDIMAPNKLQVMVDALLEKGKGYLAVGQVRYFSEKGGNHSPLEIGDRHLAEGQVRYLSDPGIGAGYARYEKWLNRLTETGSNYSGIYKECVIPSPCWMAFRDDLDACGAFQPDRYPEDYDLAFRFYEKGLKCIPCNHVLHHWRDYETRTSRTGEHYAQNYFLDIKLRYFLKLDYRADRALVLWGAGNKGKAIAKGLQEQNIPFHWVCDNPKKIGKEIYGNIMLHYSILRNLENLQIIISVANEGDQAMIKNFFTQLRQRQIADHFFFC